ncbi:MAG TPA: DNA repair exonuclease [Burkholderiaceae bacterium]|nr:DNA repair exonuclease [Burkholderiaceae bacterium]
MKFIHAADIHLDSPMAGLSAHDEAPVELLRTATRSAFRNLIDCALAEQVDFVLLPGDVFDTAWRDFNTGMFFVREMARLNAANVRAFVLRGNHDAEHEMTRSLPLPPNVHVFRADRPDTRQIVVGDLKVAIHGQSFRQAATTQNLAAAYAPVEGCLNIAMLHTALEGHAAHAHYAPCTLDQLRNLGMHYWALGHVHEWDVLSEAPWVAFSGNLQGRNVRECGPRGALLVRCEHGELQRPDRLLVDVVRWQLARIDVSAATTRAEVVAQVGEFLEQLLSDADGRPLACRVVLTGRSPAHAELFGQALALRADLVAQAMIVDRDHLWIEGIRVETQPVLESATIAARADALADLQALLANASADPQFVSSLARDFDPLLAKLPPDVLRQDVPALHALRRGDLAALIEEVGPTLIDRIAREPHEH